ncbi:MAG: thioesterase family protein [Alphaproteobacteria bacterium]
MPAFETDQTILFQHCDPAGIVFYPRYFEMLNAAVERWFDVGLGVSFAALHTDRRRGIPCVSLQTRFAAPSRLGEALKVRIAVEKLGGSSVETEFAIVDADGNIRIEGTQVQVHIDLDTGRPVRWPDDLRSALNTFTKD